MSGRWQSGDIATASKSFLSLCPRSIASARTIIVGLTAGDRPMRFFKLNAEQVVSLLAEVQQKVPLAVLTRKYGISATSIWNWRLYRGLDAKWLVRVRTLELRVQQ